MNTVAAVMENRAQEVGISVLNASTNQITLTQIVDNSLYTNTIAFLQLMDTSLVLFSQSLQGTPLHQVLIRKKHTKNAFTSSEMNAMKNLTNVKSALRMSSSRKPKITVGDPIDVKFEVLVLPRSFFSEQKGSEILNGLGRISQDQKTLSAISALSDKYVACASLYALYQYLEKSFNLRLEGDELHMNYHQPQDYMSVGTQTCKSLSLFPPDAAQEEQICLLNLFKPCTLMGKKLLRR